MKRLLCVVLLLISMFTLAEYKKVTAAPGTSKYKFINGNSITSGFTYYFKVEPIKWRVLQNTNGTYKLLSEYILDNMDYYDDWRYRTVDGSTVYGNNYMYSNVRAWLNGLDGSNYNITNYTGKGFLDIAFTEEERKFINTTLVDNSASTTYTRNDSSNIYTCSNTNDKVYLLSYKDMESYGFNDTNRSAIVSEYARSIGGLMKTSSSYYGKGYWWLRSPSFDSSSHACFVYYNGYVYNGVNAYNYEAYVYDSSLGVRPALEITI